MEEKESKVQRLKQYILRNKVLTAVAAFLFILVISTSGTVSSAVNERDALQDQLEEREQQYEELQGSLDSLTEQYQNLQGDYDNLKAELTNYQDQQSTIDDLNSQLAELQGNYDTLSAQNEELKAQNDSLNSQVSSLQTQSADAAASASYTSSTDSSGDGSGGVVWLSATGSKYHSIPDCGNMNPSKARQVSRSTAEAQGYSACSKCW